MIILGYGARGGIYGEYALAFPEEYEVVAIRTEFKIFCMLRNNRGSSRCV